MSDINDPNGTVASYDLIECLGRLARRHGQADRLARLREESHR